MVAIPGVGSVRVLFATERLVVDAPPDISLRIQDVVKRLGFTLLVAQATATTAPQAARFGEFGPLLLLTTLMMVSSLLNHVNPTLSRSAFIATTLVWWDWGRSPSRHCV